MNYTVNVFYSTQRAFHGQFFVFCVKMKDRHFIETSLGFEKWEMIHVVILLQPISCF